MAKSSSKKSVRFYLAEDIRLDRENKAMIIGLYPANKIFITLPEGMSEIPSDKGVMLPGIAILINVSGFKDNFQAKISLYTPSGSALIEDSNLGEVQTAPGNRYNFANLVAKFVPFKVLELGPHKLTVKIGQSKFEYEFSIET